MATWKHWSMVAAGCATGVLLAFGVVTALLETQKSGKGQVVDAAMVGQNVEKLTEHLRRLHKRLVAIVAGRRDDGEMLMDLINRGKVYRFLLKPVSPGRARLAVEASVPAAGRTPGFRGRGCGFWGGRARGCTPCGGRTTCRGPRTRG